MSFLRTLLGKREPEQHEKKPAPDYEKARTVVRGMMQSLKDEAELRHGKPTNTTIDECISEFEAIAESETPLATKLHNVSGIVGRLSPHNPHGRQVDHICNLPKWAQYAVEWLAAWQEQITPGYEARAAEEAAKEATK